jgi:hypothetical protein
MHSSCTRAQGQLARGAIGPASRSFFFQHLVSMPDQSGLALLAYWFGIVIGVTFVSVGMFLSLPREVNTRLRSHRVVHHVSIERGCYVRRRAYAFAQITGLGLKEYYGEPYSYLPVMTLRNGEMRCIRTANSSYLIYARTIAADLRNNRPAEARRRASTLLVWMRRQSSKERNKQRAEMKHLADLVDHDTSRGVSLPCAPGGFAAPSHTSW